MKRAKPEQIESIRCSLVNLRRLFQKRELTKLWAKTSGERLDLDYSDLRLLDAVHVAQSETKEGATVGDVSRHLGVDPSRASRIVAAALEKGLLARIAAQGDGRKVVLEVTPRGAKVQAKGSELTRARIDVALAGWSTDERLRFAQLLERFVTEIASAP